MDVPNVMVSLLLQATLEAARRKPADLPASSTSPISGDSSGAMLGAKRLDSRSESQRSLEGSSTGPDHRTSVTEMGS